MKRLLLASILTVFYLNLTAQKFQSSFVKIDSSTFRIHFTPFAFAVGVGRSDLKGSLTDQSKFIIGTNSTLFTAFSPNLQFIFKNKIGFNIGFEFCKRSLNDEKIRAGFQNNVPDYNIHIEENNNQTGYSPFRSDYNFRLFKAGLLGFIPHKRMAFIPSVDILYNIESWYPSLEVQYTQPITNYSFTREYKFEQINSLGLKIGCGLRGNYKLSKNSKRTRLTMETRLEFVYLKTSGLGYYIDTVSNGNKIKSDSNKFTQNFSAISISLTIAGIDFHWN
jgi:hypothetical protein